MQSIVIYATNDDWQTRTGGKSMIDQAETSLKFFVLGSGMSPVTSLQVAVLRPRASSIATPSHLKRKFNDVQA